MLPPDVATGPSSTRLTRRTSPRTCCAFDGARSGGGREADGGDNGWNPARVGAEPGCVSDDGGEGYACVFAGRAGCDAAFHPLGLGPTGRTGGVGLVFTGDKGPAENIGGGDTLPRNEGGDTGPDAPMLLGRGGGEMVPGGLTGIDAWAALVGVAPNKCCRAIADALGFGLGFTRWAVSGAGPVCVRAPLLVQGFGGAVAPAGNGRAPLGPFPPGTGGDMVPTR